RNTWGARGGGIFGGPRRDHGGSQCRRSPARFGAGRLARLLTAIAAAINAIWLTMPRMHLSAGYAHDSNYENETAGNNQRLAEPAGARSGRAKTCSIFARLNRTRLYLKQSLP